MWRMIIAEYSHVKPRVIIIFSLALLFAILQGLIPSLPESRIPIAILLGIIGIVAGFNLSEKRDIMLVKLPLAAWKIPMMQMMLVVFPVGAGFVIFAISPILKWMMHGVK